MIAIHTGHPHYLDHLGILCITLNLPLIITEHSTLETAKQFYPDLDCHLMDLQDLSVKFLADHFDVIFESGHRWAAELLPLFDLFFQKPMRIVYCPHGNSDKGHSYQNPIPKDLSLYYGSHMYQHLAKTRALLQLSGLVRTGNYRAAYYRARETFYHQLLSPHLNIDPSCKTVFYAPSWPDGENPSSFLSCSERVIEEVGQFFNLIIRWHPFLGEMYPAQTEQLKFRYTGKKRISFLNDFPCIYPILQNTDLYLGDFSSIGYDFLEFNRPLFFFDTYPGLLDSCGTRINWDQNFGKALLSYEDTKEKEQLRKKAYSEVFGEERKGSEILKDIKEALSSDRASWKNI